MNKRVFFVLALSVVLILGMVSMGYGSYRPLPKVRIDQGQSEAQKFVPGGKTVWQLYEFNFEGSDPGEWQSGEGLHWHHDAAPCGASGTSWRCYEPEYGDSGGYYDGWLQFLDTPEISISSGDTLEFDHKWWTENFDTSADYGTYGLWDCFGVWASTDGGNTFNFITPTSGPPYDSVCVDSGGCFGWIWNGLPDTIPAWPEAYDTLHPKSAKNPSWPNCDHSKFDLSGFAGQNVIIRFAFGSDQLYSCETNNGDTVQGWFIDSIMVGGISREDQMVPSFEQFWAKDTNWNNLNYSKSSDSSWWMPTGLSYQKWVSGGYECRGRELYEPLTSPWLWIPDSAKLVWASVYHDEYVPGAAMGGYLHDYWYMYVRKWNNGDPSAWIEMFHDYDHMYNDSTVVEGEYTRFYDRDKHWRLITPGYDDYELWQDTTTAYNRSHFAIPDWFADPGDSFQFRLIQQTDTICGNPEVEDEDADRGQFFDDFILDACTGYDCNKAIVWTNESERPLPFAVSRGLTLPIKVTCCARYSLSSTDTANVKGDVEPPNFYTGEAWEDSLDPNSCMVDILLPYFVAQKVDTILTELNLELRMDGDTYRPDNILDYLFQVTPQYTCLLGYDDHAARYGKGTSDSTGPAVKYSVHDGCYKEPEDSAYYVFGVSFDSYDGPEPATQPGHEFTLHIYDNAKGLPSNPPLQTVMGNELGSLTDTTSGDNTWQYFSFDPMVHIPGDTFWVWFEHTDKSSSFPGMASDGVMCDGERSWQYYMNGDSLSRGEEPSLRGSPEDWMMRARIIPVSQRRFITGRVDTATAKGLPVEGVLVVAEMHTTGPGSAPIRYDYTDASGNYSIDCWAGVYDLRVSRIPPGFYGPYGCFGAKNVDVTLDNAVEDFELSLYPAFIRGDATTDGAVSISDVVHMARVMFDPTYADYGVYLCKSSFDANDDESASISDVVHLARVMFDPTYADYGVYLAPYPDCGLDPTSPGLLPCEDFSLCCVPPSVDKGKCVTYVPPVSVKGAENKVVVGETEVSGRSVVVSVNLTTVEPVAGFSYTIKYDPSLLTVKSVNCGLDFDFFSPAIDNEKGEITVGNIPSWRMEEMLSAGSHRVAEITFEVKKRLKQDVPLELTAVELVSGFASGGCLPCEWVNGLVKTGTSTSPLPKEFNLSQNCPNPFNPTTLIKYDLPVDCQVRLDVYNVVGQRVTTLVDGEQKAGYKTAIWNAKQLASGIYFYRIRAGEFTAIKKMVLLK